MINLATHHQLRISNQIDVHLRSIKGCHSCGKGRLRTEYRKRSPGFFFLGFTYRMGPFDYIYIAKCAHCEEEEYILEYYVGNGLKSRSNGLK